MKTLAGLVSMLAAAAGLAQAHFVFVVPEANGSAARVFISETLEPDAAVGPELVKDATLSVRASGGGETALRLVRSGEVFTVALAGEGTRVIHGTADLGVSGAAGKEYLLFYHPKSIVGDGFAASTNLGGAEPVELIPQGKAGAVRLLFVAEGKPMANAEVTVIQPDGKQKIVKTDAAGLTETFAQKGRYGAWARYIVPNSAGEREGKKYVETRHYATLVFDDGGTANSQASTPASVFATLPQASASLGAVASDGWLYVYGGHISPTHNYSVEAVTGRMDRLRLTGEPVWEELPGGPAVQGMNLAAHEGKIIRVGGMMPQNKKGEPADNVSIADAARFDPKTKRWEELPALPEGRSSHDVVVIGDKLYVVAGWTMNGKGKDETWAKTMQVLDLKAPQKGWTAVPQPFERRALMAAAMNGKLYVVGGINSEDVIESTVNIYDPATGKWAEGPLLPEGGVLGFSPAAVVHKGKLYVSVADGTLIRLNEAAGKWEPAGKSTPRVAHRMASLGDSILVIGGANGGKNSNLIEAVKVD